MGFLCAALSRTAAQNAAFARPADAVRRESLNHRAIPRGAKGRLR